MDRTSRRARDLVALVRTARLACGCYQCAGMREIGAHTIATPDKPRATPSSCLANAVLVELFRKPDKWMEADDAD